VADFSETPYENHTTFLILNAIYGYVSMEVKVLSNHGHITQTTESIFDK
jgi:hypothetical protein